MSQWLTVLHKAQSMLKVWLRLSVLIKVCIHSVPIKRKLPTKHDIISKSYLLKVVWHHALRVVGKYYTKVLCKIQFLFQWWTNWLRFDAVCDPLAITDHIWASLSMRSSHNRALTLTLDEVTATSFVASCFTGTQCTVQINSNKHCKQIVVTCCWFCAHVAWKWQHLRPWSSCGAVMFIVEFCELCWQGLYLYSTQFLGKDLARRYW